MELAIPILALGGLYVISNQSNKEPVPKEAFTGNKKPYVKQSYPINYPVVDNNELLDTDYKYVNPNTATDKYYDQTKLQNGGGAKDVISLTGDYLAPSNFKHNNLVPFYGAKMRGQQTGLDRAESTLDNMVGAGSKIQKKVEKILNFSKKSKILVKVVK
jgi:hypothetical protein